MTPAASRLESPTSPRHRTLTTRRSTPSRRTATSRPRPLVLTPAPETWCWPYRRAPSPPPVDRKYRAPPHAPIPGPQHHPRPGGNVRPTTTRYSAPTHTAGSPPRTAQTPQPSPDGRRTDQKSAHSTAAPAPGQPHRRPASTAPDQPRYPTPRPWPATQANTYLSPAAPMPPTPPA